MLPHNQNYCGKTVSITYCECVSVAFLIENKTRMLCIVMSSVYCLALPYFFISSHKRHDFWRSVIEQETCVLIYSTNVFWHISYYNKNLTRYYHKFVQAFTWSIRYSGQVLLKPNFVLDNFFFENSTNSKFHKNPSCTSLDVSCEQTDGQKIDRYDGPSSRFSQLAEDTRIFVI